MIDDGPESVYVVQLISTELMRAGNGVVECVDLILSCLSFCVRHFGVIVS